jgi:putative ubiquitin-RnfH superfamily antitoxin RatB of RatAB toxin-antitoxin module
MVINVSLVYSPHEQAPLVHLLLSLQAGATVRDALQAANFYEQFPETRALTIGIHSKIVSFEEILEPNDRIEIYRPLKIDPKSARRQRAKRQM